MASTCFHATSSFFPLTTSTPPSACPSKNPITTILHHRRTSSSRIRATAGGDNDDGHLLWLPRRDILTGITAAGLSVYPTLTSTAVDTTTLQTCRRGDKVNDKVVDCTDPNKGFPCPPSPSSPAIDFTAGRRRSPRVRRAVHLLTLEEQEKYKEAVGKMRALPSCNPLSFTAQAAIHQSYCDGHYRYDPTEKNAPFDVHFSWIFAPWHRMYMYFYEKALGDLIGDDTFALPYWSWDSPEGMTIPAIFKNDGNNNDNPLYDRDRNEDHLDKLVHLDRNDQSDLITFDNTKLTSNDTKYNAEVFRNLCVVYQQQIRLGKDARAFLGEKLCTEMKNRDTNASQGTLESMAHTAMHIWTGRSGPPAGAACCSGDNDGFLDHDGVFSCRNDMGFLGTAGRDPIFYSHHANVDRMWYLWSTVLGNKGFDDTEWLDASFDFYDNFEKPELVRVTFRDVLDTLNLGYTYEDSSSELPWLKCELTSLVPSGGGGTRPSPEKNPVFPVTLTKDEVVEVAAVAVPAAKPPAKQRVLVIEGIEYDPRVDNKFDVAINVPGDDALKVGPQYAEYAGTFAVVPSSKVGGGTVKGKIALCIDGVLEDIGAVGASTVDVVIVPRSEAQIKLNLPPTIQG